MNNLMTPVMILSLAFLPACSDDSEASKDLGTQLDKGALIFADQGTIGDQGQTMDRGQSTSDQAAHGDLVIPLKVEEYVPANNVIADWVENTAVGSPGVEAGYTAQEIDDIINGSHDPYAQEGCKGFAKQDFINGAGDTLSLFLWDMNTAAGARNMFDKDKADAETNDGLIFEGVPNVTEKGIIATVGPSWKGYFYKSTYIGKLDAKVATGGDKMVLKGLVITFVQQLTGSLP